MYRVANIVKKLISLKVIFVIFVSAYFNYGEVCVTVKINACRYISARQPHPLEFRGQAVISTFELWPVSNHGRRLLSAERAPGGPCFSLRAEEGGARGDEEGGGNC